MATHSQHIHTFFPEISDKYRLEILKDLKKYSSLLQQSHLINNRWENLYLDPPAFFVAITYLVATFSLDASAKTSPSLLKILFIFISEYCCLWSYFHYF